MSGSPGPCFEEERGGSEIRDRDQSKYDLCKHGVQEMIAITHGTNVSLVSTISKKSRKEETALL